MSNTLFAELAWRRAHHNQAEDRTHGVGRGKEKVRSVSYYLVAKNTIEEKLLTALDEQEKIVGAVLDGKNTKQGEEVFDLLEKSLLGEPNVRSAVQKFGRNHILPRRVKNTPRSVSRRVRRKR